jgi:hypothetical protein
VVRREWNFARTGEPSTVFTIRPWIDPSVTSVYPKYQSRLATNLLIAVEGDPPADIYQLQNVTFVMKGGVTDKVLKVITKPVV